MADLAITVVTAEGEETHSVPEGTTAMDLVGGDRRVVVARINGELRDLATPLSQGDVVEAVAVDTPEGLAVLRHSTAHVLAQAVQDTFSDAKLGIGPPIKDGFYYDFSVTTPFTPDDLKALEKRMQQIVKSGQRFHRRVVTESEAKHELAGEPFKLRLIGSEGGAEVMEVGGSELTIYDNVQAKDGAVCWGDLCRGPHVPDTRYIVPNAFKLMRTAAAYWLGDQSQDQLQRIYGTAWPDKEQLQAYLTFLEEAEKRDHRKLGAEMDLFSFPEEIGSGLAVFHPKGGVVRRVMEDYSRRRHEEAGYEFVNTPHITKAALFEKSGHLDWYAEGMYPPMQLDADIDDTGHVRRQGADYYLKPMNCPMHNLIFDARGRSYRELPLRLFEFGTVYRYEKSGVVQGMTRARGFTQDDAHIYCTREQMADELDKLLTFVLDLLRDYGLEDFYLELSTRDPEKSVGSDEVWAEATEVLREAAEKQGLELVLDEGGAAFYGPKISVQTKDAIGRTWQMSTIQLDFNLPERFDLEYAAADGTRQRRSWRFPSRMPMSTTSTTSPRACARTESVSRLMTQTTACRRRSARHRSPRSPTCSLPVMTTWRRGRCPSDTETAVSAMEWPWIRPSRRSSTRCTSAARWRVPCHDRGSGARPRRDARQVAAVMDPAPRGLPPGRESTRP